MPCLSLVYTIKLRTTSKNQNSNKLNTLGQFTVCPQGGGGGGGGGECRPGGMAMRSVPDDVVEADYVRGFARPTVVHERSSRLQPHVVASTTHEPVVATQPLTFAHDCRQRENKQQDNFKFAQVSQRKVSKASKQHTTFTKSCCMYVCM